MDDEPILRRVRIRLEVVGDLELHQGDATSVDGGANLRRAVRVKAPHEVEG